MKLSSCALLMGSLVQADYPGYTIPNEPQHLAWAQSSDELAFDRIEGKKEFVKYQMPDDEYVPIDHLPIVFLNGIKFHRQGKQPKQDMLDRFRKITRSSDGHLKCKGQTKAKLHQEHHQSHQMANDVPAGFIGMEHRNLDLISTIFQTKYPRYNGRDAPLPYDELVKVDDLTNLEPENEYEFKMINDVQVREEGEFEEEEEEYIEVNFPNPEYIQPYIVDEGEEPITEAEIEAIRLRNLKSSFKTQDKVKIGCCNGLPYNSSKRCCCRRIPFDKEHKFCCAINGCESFQIFDRSNKQHYKDCLSLSGLVIQEYGYHGQAGQPLAPQRKMARGGK
jgi:hypothetical protein